MPEIRNKRHIFKEYVSKMPIVGQSSVTETSTIDLENVALNGGILIKTLVLSIEPLVRAFMHEAGSHVGRFTIGEPMSGVGIGRVIRTDNEKYQVGDHVSGMIPHQEYSVLSGDQLNILQVIKTKHEKLPWSAYVGVLGLAGATGYGGWKEYSEAKKGEIAFVSAGASAVGSIVAQLAKQDGCKVIASAGSDAKVQQLKDMGVDVAFNYKTTDTREVLKKEGPIDVFWDNVGGDTLDAALENMNTLGRILICGAASGYATGGHIPIKNLFNAIGKQLTLKGINCLAYIQKYREEMMTRLASQLASGEVKYFEDRREGLESVGQAVVDMLNGDVVGKVVVVVADE